MINAEQLDQLVEEFESHPEKFEQALAKLESNHLLLIDILLGSHEEVLNNDEMDFLAFLFVLLYDAVSQAHDIPAMDESLIEKTDESTWEIINNNNNNLEQCYEHFEKLVTESELLDLVYTSLEPDEDNEYDITDAGRLVMTAVLVTELRVIAQEELV